MKVWSVICSFIGLLSWTIWSPVAAADQVDLESDNVSGEVSEEELGSEDDPSSNESAEEEAPPSVEVPISPPPMEELRPNSKQEEYGRKDLLRHIDAGKAFNKRDVSQNGKRKGRNYGTNANRPRVKKGKD
ncbi:MAG: hypothetical protein AB7T49_05960 [Oligoflexales bacterium]